MKKNIGKKTKDYFGVTIMFLDIYEEIGICVM
jgi:hypothetical protein